MDGRGPGQTAGFRGQTFIMNPNFGLVQLDRTGIPTWEGDLLGQFGLSPVILVSYAGCGTKFGIYKSLGSLQVGPSLYRHLLVELRLNLGFGPRQVGLGRPKCRIGLNQLDAQIPQHTQTTT